MTLSSEAPSLRATIQLIPKLHAEGIRVSLKGENLRVTAAKGSMLSPETRELLKAHKETLVTFLKDQANASAQNESIPVVARNGRLPLSFSQQQLWFLEQLNEEQSAYHIPITFQLEGDIHVDLLEETFQRLLQRHEILRTAYLSHEGAPYAAIAEEAKVDIQFTDLRGKEVNPQKLTAELLKKPMDLTHPPLFHAAVYQATDQRYVVVLIFHHLIADGWSLVVLFQELAEIYTALAEQRTPSLPNLPIQFIDYAAWQRSQDASGQFDRNLAYWQESLAGMPPILDLPTDYQRPQAFSFAGDSHYFQFAPELTDKISTFLQQENVTLFMFLQSAIQILLYRYSQQTDFAIGSPVANRDRAEIENLLGDFMNPLALRAQIVPDRPFRAHLQQVRQNTLEAMSHRAMPFDKFVTNSSIKRQAGYNPIYQVLFALQNAGPLEASFGDVSAIMLDVKPETAMMDLFFEMWSDENGHASGLVEYSTELFSSETIARVAQHLEGIVTHIVVEPDTQIGRIPLVTGAEREQILVEWNDTAIEYENLPAPYLISKRAQETPDKVAVRFADKAITYGELDAQSNRVAHYLHSLGVTPDTLVGIMMNRSADMMVALLGIWKAGGAYVPLDPTYPVGRLRYMIENSELPVLVTEKALLQKIGDIAPQVVLWDQLSGVLATQSALPPEIALNPEDRSYVIYTSGSTGRPKGVQVPHRALTNFLWSMQQEPGMTADDVLLSVTTLSFDIHTLELWTPLITGAELIVCGSETAVDSYALAELIEQRNVSILQATPATWKLLIDGDWNGRADLKMLCGGEPLPYHLARQLHRLGGELWNMYGPTETTVWSSISQVMPGFDTITIGRPIANTQLYILDEHLQPVPIGAVGALYIGGDGVTHGYWKRPELTDEKFIDSPFTEGKIYDTGDLARYTADGEVVCLGRSDHQVKVRGFRIELGEIETAVGTFEGIQDSVVIVREDTQDDKRIVAYYIADQKIDTKELHSHVSNYLPYYMVPSFFMKMERFPLTPNGKIDRKQLPAPDYSGETGRAEFVAPETEMQQTVANIWADILQVEQIGLHDNFFDLGGHSLLITRVINRVLHTLEVRLSLNLFFEAPTVADLAEHIERLQSEGREELAPIPIISRRGQLDLSHSQQQIWFLEQLDPELPAYSIPMTFRLHSPIDIDLFEQALQQLIDRHEVLRTGYPTSQGEPYGAVHEGIQAKIDFADMRGQAVDAQALTAELVAEPFDLSQPLLLRNKVYRVDEEEYLVIFIVHHIIVDGWSLNILFVDFAEMYDALCEGRKPKLENLPIQYLDFAAWQQEMDRTGGFDKDLDYWQDTLSGMPPILNLPTDYKRPDNFDFQGDSVSFSFSPELTEKVELFLRQENVTLYMFLQAAIQTLMYRYSQQTDFAIGSPVANRDRPEVEHLLGNFMNLLVLRAQIEPGQTFTDHLKQVKQSTLDALAHRMMPFDKVVKNVKFERIAGYNPIYQVLFALQNAENREGALIAGKQAKFEAVSSDTAVMDLFFEMWMDENAPIAGRLEYSTNLFTSESMEQMLQHFEMIVAGAVADPSTSLATLNLITPSERKTVLQDWNQTTAPYDKLPVPQLIHLQAEATPTKTAVRAGQQAIDYKRLDQWSSRLAHYLRKQGVENESLVGVMMDRSIEAIVALLAIWKAGGAYVPLDPNYPESRLSHMITDSGLPLIIVDKAFASDVPESNAISLIWEDIQKQLDREPTTLPEQTISSSNRAYVIYTSGSTGKPKGVQVPHRALTNFVWSMHKNPGISGHDTVLNITTLSFDIHVLEVWVPLITGAEMVICDTNTAVDGPRLAQLLQQRKITVMQATPATWKLLIDSGWSGQPNMKMLCGGEPLSHNLATQLLARGEELWNMYGPTETTVWSTISQITPEFEQITIGRPVANTQVYVLDTQQQPVPAGVVGELWIGGDGVTLGYLNRPELTASRFISNPFNGNGLIYNTGDLARFTNSGELICLGRSDSQVKVRGYRIELGEIETNLSQHEKVQDCVVIVREDTPNDKHIVAYYRADTSISSGVLYDFLHDRLPYYMVPTNFVLLNEFPLTPNGKINRLALPAPSHVDGLYDKSEFVAPRDKLEQDLAKLWESVLKVKHISVHDNFFHLGGHSLTALRLFSGIDKLTARKLPLATLFEAPTIATLAERIRDSDLKPKWSSIVPIKPNGHKRPFFYVSPYDISVLEMRTIAHHFDENRPFYGVQPHGLSEGETPHETLQQMAAHYVMAIKDIVPNGPYFLGGHCAGAWVAYEMAYQLEQSGSEVGYLGLVDIAAPTYEPPQQSTLSYVFNRAAYYMNDRRLFNALAWQVKMQAERSILYRSSSPTVKRIQDVRLAHDKAFEIYDPKIGYTGPMAVIRSSDNMSIYGDENWSKKWEELTTQQVEFIDIDSTHAKLIDEPFVQELSKALVDGIKEQDQSVA